MCSHGEGAACVIRGGAAAVELGLRRIVTLHHLLIRFLTVITNTFGASLSEATFRTLGGAQLRDALGLRPGHYMTQPLAELCGGCMLVLKVS